MCFFSPEASNFGNLLTGLGTTALAIGTIFQLRAWRVQQIHTRKAEIAGEALAITIRLFQALNFITSPVIDSPEDPAEVTGLQSRSYRQRRDFATRLKVTEGDLQKFVELKNKSEVYLPDNVNEKLDALWKEWISIKVDLELFLDFLDMRTPPRQRETTYEHVFGSSGRELREQLRKDIYDILKPIARLE